MSVDAELPVLDGDDFWVVWEELDAGQRRTIHRAVRTGQALEDPGLASLAVSVARNRQRSAPALLLYVFLLAGGILATVLLLPRVPLSTRTWPAWVAIFVVALVTPLVRLLTAPVVLRRARQAEALNLEVVRGAPHHAARTPAPGQ